MRRLFCQLLPCEIVLAQGGTELGGVGRLQPRHTNTKLGENSQLHYNRWTKLVWFRMLSLHLIEYWFRVTQNLKSSLFNNLRMRDNILHIAFNASKERHIGRRNEQWIHISLYLLSSGFSFGTQRLRDLYQCNCVTQLRDVTNGRTLTLRTTDTVRPLPVFFPETF